MNIILFFHKENCNLMSYIFYRSERNVSSFPNPRQSLWAYLFHFIFYTLNLFNVHVPLARRGLAYLFFKLY